MTIVPVLDETNRLVKSGPAVPVMEKLVGQLHAAGVLRDERVELTLRWVSRHLFDSCRQFAGCDRLAAELLQYLARGSTTPLGSAEGVHVRVEDDEHH